MEISSPEVLVIGNSAIVLAGIVSVLRETGICVRTMNSAGMVDRLQPRAIVIDCVAIDTVARLEVHLRQFSTFSPVVAVLGALRVDWVVAALGAGALGVVALDSSTESIRKALKAALSGRFYCETNSLVTSIADVPQHSLDRAHGLTAREQEIAGMILLGLSNKEIAFRFDISEQCVKIHVSNLLRKTHTHNRSQLAVNLSLNTPLSCWHFDSPGRRRL